MNKKKKIESFFKQQLFLFLPIGLASITSLYIDLSELAAKEFICPVNPDVML